MSETEAADPLGFYLFVINVFPLNALRRVSFSFAPTIQLEPDKQFIVSQPGQ